MTNEKIPISELVVCEGKYDKIKLDSVIDGDIITLDGFGIFNSAEKRGIIKKAALSRGVIVITDSDSAGMVIRNHINNITGNCGISHIYIPTVKGKEHRKDKASAEGLLGVEGMERNTLLALLKLIGQEAAGVRIRSQGRVFSRTDLWGAITPRTSGHLFADASHFPKK